MLPISLPMGGQCRGAHGGGLAEGMAVGHQIEYLRAARSGEESDLREPRLEGAAVDGDAVGGVEELGHGRHESDLAELPARDVLIDIGEDIKCNCLEYRRQFLPLGARTPDV
jgi:hypothetical protein